MAFDQFVAIRFTSYYASLTDWPDHLGRVFGAFGFHTRNPTALEFVTAVREWQLEHPPLKADGLLGPQTWNELLPAVRAYTGPVPAGTRPDWVGPLRPTTGALNLPPAAVANPVTHDAEDRVLHATIQQWLHAGGRLEANPYVAVPVGIEYASDVARESSLTVPTGGICGDLQVGQVWPGLMGNRVVVATITGSFPATAAIVFITDSGQAYYQTAEAWSLDYLAGVYAGVARNLAPLHTLLGTETQALLGAIPVCSGGGFAAVVGTGVTQWVLDHRDDIAKGMVSVASVVTALVGVRAIAPMLFDKLVGGFFKPLVADTLSAATDPKVIARFVGGVLVKSGKPTLTQHTVALADALVPVAKWAATSGEVAEFIREVAARGGVLTPDEAEQILAEVRNAPAEIKKLIDQLQNAIQVLR